MAVKGGSNGGCNGLYIDFILYSCDKKKFDKNYKIFKRTGIFRNE